MFATANWIAIIIATGVRLCHCGVRLRGWRAMGIFADRRQHG